MVNKISHSIYRVLSSNKFFYVIIGLLIIQAAWFALTAQYPMAFDENYHFGLIQIYSHQWLPFINNAPANSAIYGEITRYDSYLYHYLMSFPYRIIASFIHQQSAQIIIMRFLNIGLFAGGMILFRQLFNRLKISKTMINFSLLMLVLIPAVPFLAATINYDNLIFVLVPLIASLALDCRDGIVLSGKIPVTRFILLITVGILGSLVKYPFLPIFGATIIYLAVIFIRTSSKATLIKATANSFKSLRHWLQVTLIIAMIISGGLFIERYGVNLFQYHSLEPECSKIQATSYCVQYGPWARNNRITTNIIDNDPDYDPQMFLFVPYWFGGMIYRLYFAINYDYSNDLPLPIPITIAAIIGFIGLIILVVFRKIIISIDRRLLLFVTILALYIGAIFYINLTEYLRYRTMLAVNGRYLVIVLPFLFILMGLAYRQLFKRLVKKRLESFVNIFAVVIILLLLQGGGMFTYLIRGESGWYWQDKSVIDFNLNLKNIISPLIISGKG